jgi:hypothetical protein
MIILYNIIDSPTPTGIHPPFRDTHDKEQPLPKPSPFTFAATLALLLAGEAAMAKPAPHHVRALPHTSTPAPAPTAAPIAQRYAAASHLLNEGAGAADRCQSVPLLHP